MNRNFKICVQNLNRQFRDGNKKIIVLQDVSISFEQGKTYAIMGASGSGKSTLLHLIAGLDVPDGGTIFFGEHNLTFLSSRERASSVGLVFQSPYLIKELTVLENVMIAGTINDLSEKMSNEKALFLLEEVGLEMVKDWDVGALSGGQRQRVSIARALMNDPAFLIADEPTGNLDEESGAALIKMLLGYRKKRGMGIIISSHDRLVTSQMEHVFILKGGMLSEIVKQKNVETCQEIIA